MSAGLAGRTLNGAEREFFGSMAADTYALMSTLVPILPVLLGAAAALELVASTSVSEWPPRLWCDSNCAACWVEA
jgi:hypothetical protein